MAQAIRLGTGPSDDVAQLHAAFERLRRRHTRLDRVLRRSVAEAEELIRRSRVTIAMARDEVGYHPIWSRWSEADAEVADAADRLLRARPQSLLDLVMIFTALEWVLLTDQVIIDRAAERQLRRFGRALRELLTQTPPQLEPPR